MTTEPKLTEADVRREFAATGAEPVIRFLRERGLIAEEPVDPLLVEAREVCQRVSDESGEGHYRRYLEGDWDNGRTMKVALAALRRGMELAPRKLTREMVEHAVRPNVTLVSGGGGCLCEVTIDCATIHAALTEALQ